MDLPKRETARLRFGRFSKPDSSYFITLCTKNRIRVLTDPTQGNRMIEVLQTMHVTGDINLMASTIMPDHLHLLLALGQRLRVGQVMAKIKSLSRHLGHVPWHWQDDGFEHQLRPNESVDD